MTETRAPITICAHRECGSGMMGPGSNVRVYLACGVTDLRKGIDGLMALVQTALRQKPASGSVFAFRGRRGDRIKLLFWDGQGRVR
jgi:transposase